MAGFDAHLVNLVDARIRENTASTTATGTVVSTSGAYVYVVLDGDSQPLPCKFVAGLTLHPDVRVVLHKYGDDWTVTGSFGKAYWPRYSYDQTVLANSTATPGLGSPEVGVTFLAPPSGKVLVSVGGYVAQSVNDNSAHLSFALRTGSDWSDGQQVIGFEYKRGIMAGQPVNVGAAPEDGSVNTSPVESLVPGGEYIVRAGFWSAPAGTCTVHARFVMVNQV
ncbi:hypothetical protein [Micromonospora aurantiaca (nom. illeg.)]|uniref:Uncharacterized protein n=1 Tax=Micromonospora aurantiaca (nom. illeg.) TaxID=47850 RepID=A0ABQ6UFM5_9ACTN|nr:hypothetical protein [Micromonospora aurantiaca]KAB1111970.1 hypothetical protein F6X54_15965 [Micromonospora aurantiaca]